MGCVSVGQTAVEVAANSPPSTPKLAVKSSVPSPVTSDYALGIDDIISVSVWKEPELSKVVPVRPDGKITLPLVGDIQAAGKTTSKLQQELHESLAAYVATPEVTVIVQEVRSRKFNIVGEVARPGSYPLSEAMTVLDAIAQAGGLGIYAKSNSIYVLRPRSDGSSLQLPFRYKDVLKGSNLTHNIRLEPHDTIVVP
jgi:polysaccharide export outer membrane protein